MKILVWFTFFCLFAFTQKASSQEQPTAWDDTLTINWSVEFNKVEITSSLDGDIQPAIFFKSPLPEKQPLIVSLHTWSGDYLQEDPLAEEIVLRGCNYIHPNFRGPNNNTKACGSKFAISDIEDAIHFAIKNGNVDTSEIHIIGVSGGGYAALMAFMHLDYPVKSFNSWAAISNLEDWYFECEGRKLKYVNDLKGVTTGGQGFDTSVARERSPALLPYSSEKRKNAELYIYTGIHDGYTGSVPITHSINMFNHLLRETSPHDKDQIVSDSLKLVLLEKRHNPKPDSLLSIGGRKIHLLREIPNIQLIIFEGTHEMIVPQALALVPVHNQRSTTKLNILTVGDSNGAAQNGWPVQLAKILPFSTIINHSISGNTIGFDNLGNAALNTIKNIEIYLDSAFKKLPAGQQLDYIVFGLGTNDSKKVFNDSIKLVQTNLDSLLILTEKYMERNDKSLPGILVVSPPPINEEIANPDKYGGGNERIDINNFHFQKVAEKHHAVFIDVNAKLKNRISEITFDGVHLTSEAQIEVAQTIIQFLKPDSN